MDLLCPHCTRRVSVPDEQAGQATSCSLCGNKFMAPTLAPGASASRPAAPPAPPPPVSSTVPVPSEAPPESYGVSEPPLPPVPPPSPPLPPVPSAIAPPSPALPPVPPGEYTQSHVLHMTGDWLALAPPICVLGIFFLSPFNWHFQDADRAYSLWGLSFSSAHGQAQFLGYTILMFLCLPLTIVAALFDKKWIQAPPQLAPALVWKNLAIGVILGLAFMSLCFDYLHGHFMVGNQANPIAVAMKLAIRLHFIAVASSFLMFWLTWRKSFNLPQPKMEVQW